MYIKTCELCGEEFETPSNRAKYCRYCRDKANAMRQQAFQQRKKEGQTSSIGSTKNCEACGKPFKVKSGSQKYCEDCAKKQANAKKGQPTPQYMKEHYSYISFPVSKEEGEEFREYAKQKGMSIKDLFVTALREYQLKDKDPD